MVVHHIYVGSYTDKVSTLAFDSDAQSLTLVADVTVGYHPSWVTSLPSDPSIVFSTLEQDDGAVATIRFDASGSGTVVATAPTHGAGPCSLAVAHGQLLVGNYSSPVFTAIPLWHGGHLRAAQSTTVTFSGQGPNKERQETSHPHQVAPIVHPAPGHEEELLVPDLGADKTWRLTPSSDKTSGWTVRGHVQYEPGSGPRHVVFHDGILYTLCELSNTLTAHRLPPLSSSSSPTHLSTLPTLAHIPDPATMLAAELLLVPPYLYASTRNDPSPAGDAVSVFSFANDTLERVAEVHTGLKHLRGMQFSKDGRWLVAGGAQGGGVKVFERVDDGRALKEVAKLDLEAPTAFLWT